MSFKSISSILKNQYYNNLFSNCFLLKQQRNHTDLFPLISASQKLLARSQLTDYGSLLQLINFLTANNLALNEVNLQ